MNQNLISPSLLLLRIWITANFVCGKWDEWKSVKMLKSTWSSALAIFAGSFYGSWPFNECPVDLYFLSKNFFVVYGFQSCLSRLIWFKLNQSITFEETRPSIQIQTNVFNVTMFCKFIINVFFLCFLVNSCYKENPTFDG